MREAPEMRMQDQEGRGEKEKFRTREVDEGRHELESGSVRWDEGVRKQDCSQGRGEEAKDTESQQENERIIARKRIRILE
eukprot:761369-Hanusia_phi.AAC.1